VVMDFGVFVCSGCSGIHREMNHKVKGIAMCNFSDKEIEILTSNGNGVSIYLSFCLLRIEFDWLI
jgi:Putative GTPase activating protein for Arf